MRTPTQACLDLRVEKEAILANEILNMSPETHRGIVTALDNYIEVLTKYDVDALPSEFISFRNAFLGMRCKSVETVQTNRFGAARTSSVLMSYYSTDPEAAGRTPAETNSKAAGNMVGYMHLLNEETPEAIAGTHHWVRCHDDAEGAKRLIRGEEGFIMRETDTFIRLVPVRVVS